MFCKAVHSLAQPASFLRGWWTSPLPLLGYPTGSNESDSSTQPKTIYEKRELTTQQDYPPGYV